MAVPVLETQYRALATVGKEQSPCCGVRATTENLALPRGRVATLGFGFGLNLRAVGERCKGCASEGSRPMACKTAPKR